MTKRVVFAGGVQVKALAKAYRLDVALDYDEDVYFIGAESIAREAAQKVVAAADILVTDLTPNGPTVRDELIKVGTLRIAVPVVTADFLWPYAAGAHPHNTYAPGLPEGPYPAGFGDSYLDRMAREGVAMAEAIRRYVGLDVARDAGLDEMRDATLFALRAMDARTGFDLADFVDHNFRTQWLFATRDRPNLPLYRHIAARLFGQMGIAVSRINQLSETFFPPGAMPIHPAVLAHFGIENPAPDTRYPILDEGFFTFEQYCRRYWTYDFNRLLHSAIAKADSNPSEAIPELRLALETSPDSVSGQRALKDAERAVSDFSMLTPLALSAPPAAALVPALPSMPLAAPAQAAPPGLAPPPGRRPLERPQPELRPAALRLPPEVVSSQSQGALIPRSAFGSGLVRSPPAGLPAPADAGADDPPLPSLRFSSFPIPEDQPAPLSGGELVPLTSFPELPEDPPLVQLPPDDAPEPEPQPYVELGKVGDAPLLAAPAAANRGYTPLAPADHLIPMLPRMLPNTRGMAGAVDKAFIDMPETMPPPPLRPVLPPELHPEPVKESFMSKLMDQLRK